MNSKKLARIAACRLKGHEMAGEVCWTCYWEKNPVPMPTPPMPALISTSKKVFLKIHGGS